MPVSQRRLNSEASRHKNLKPILLCLALAMLTFITFWQVKNCEFINLDDDIYIYNNVHVQSGLTWDNVRWAFSAESVRISGHWHPVTWLSLMLDCQIFGLNPHGYHLINLLLHVINTVLLFLIFHRMTKALWQSAFVAALFAIHPLHVESVVWVTERKDVLSTFFWMLTMGSYVLYNKRRTVGTYSLVLVIFTIGLMCKTMLITLPFVLVLLDYWPLGILRKDTEVKPQWTQIRAAIWEKLPLFMLAGVSSVVTQLAFRKAGTISLIPLLERLQNAIRAYAVYPLKMVWPIDLAVFYPHPHPGSWPQWQVGGAALFFVVITLMALRMIKKSPYLAIGWLWYVVTLVPVIGLVQAGSQSMADRYTYISLIGLFIMVAWGVPHLLQEWRYRKEVLFTLSIFSIFCLCFITWVQISYWQNSFTLLDHTLKVTVRNSYIHNIRGLAYKNLGNYERAIDDYNRAVEIDPEDAETYNNRGIAYCGLNNFSKAIIDFNRAVEINPRDADLYNNRGAAFNGLGNHKQAITDLSRAIEINHNYAKAYFNRGLAYNGSGNYRQAITDFQKAVEINPAYAADAYNNAGAAFNSLHDYKNAISCLDRVIEINPKHGTAYFNRGVAYFGLGDYAKAIDDFDRAIEIYPNYAKAYYNRGVTYNVVGNYRQAIEDFNRAIEINPGFAHAYYNRGVIYGRLGDNNVAVNDFKTAAELGNERAKDLLKRQGING